MVSMTRGATRGTRRDADPRRRSRRQLRRLPAQAEGRNDRLAGQLHDLHPAPPEAASGTLEPRHVVVPLREMCPHAELVLGRVNGHDRSAKTVALVDAAPKHLPEIPRGLGRYAAKRLELRGIEIHVGTTLESFDGTEAVLADGTRIPARTLVWTAGVRASPLLPDLDLPLDEKGRVLVDETMRVELFRGRLGARRLRRGEEREDARRRRPAHVPARAAAGEASREEPDAPAEAVRLPHAGTGRDPRPLQGDRRASALHAEG